MVMLPHKWFGEAWNPHRCVPEDHTETPVDAPCLYCERPIAANDQGLTMPAQTGHQVIDGVEHWVFEVRACHIDCFLDRVLPHTKKCPRCRGLEWGEHWPGCNYRTGESDGACSCKSLCDKHGLYDRTDENVCPQCWAEHVEGRA